MILITEQVKLGLRGPNMAVEDPNIEEFSLDSEEEMFQPTPSPSTIPPSSPSEQQYIAFSSERQSNSLSEQQSDFPTEKQQKKLSSQDKQQQQAHFPPSSQAQIPSEPQQQNRCLLQGGSEGEIFNQSSQELHPRFTLGSPVVSSNSQENDYDDAQDQSTKYSQEDESLVRWRQGLDELLLQVFGSDFLAGMKNKEKGKVTEIPSTGGPALSQSVPGIGGGVEVSTLVSRESPTRPASLTNSTTPTTTTPNEPNQERLEPTIIKRSPLALEMLKFMELEQLFRQIEEKKQQVEKNKEMMATSAQEDAMLRDLREAERRIGQHLQAQKIKVGKLCLLEPKN